MSTTNSKTGASLSARVRPNSEAAPWVIAEIVKLEAQNQRLTQAMKEMIFEADRFTGIGDLGRDALKDGS